MKKETVDKIAKSKLGYTIMATVTMGFMGLVALPLAFTVGLIAFIVMIIRSVGAYLVISGVDVTKTVGLPVLDSLFSRKGKKTEDKPKSEPVIMDFKHMFHKEKGGFQ